MPKISIIVPVYNTESYLSRCIDSILSQSFTDFELLLVDDGSTDGSGKICDAYAEKDSRIRVFHKENGGVSSARNLGLDNAKGDWVYFVDSDDELLPGCLQLLTDGISSDCDIVLGGYNTYNEAGELVTTFHEGERLIFPKEKSLSTIYQFHSDIYPYLGYMWLRLFRRNIIHEKGIRFDTDITIKEDTLFTVRYICRSNGKTWFDSTPVYKYKMRGESAMSGWRKGFNYNYVTSFYALQRMKHEIDNYYSPRSEIVFIAKEGLWIRFNWIKNKLEKLGIEDSKLMTELQLELRKEKIGFVFMVRKKMRKIIRKFGCKHLI